MNYIPKQHLLIIKFEHNEKNISIYSRNGRKMQSLFSYWRSKTGFKWCKVLDHKTRIEILWFNQNNYGFSDKQTVKKIY